MGIEIRVPPLPESVSDATIASWLKKTGERVYAEEPLLELETDKVVLEVPALEDGILSEVKVAQGATVHEGEMIAIITPYDASDSAQPPNLSSASPSVRKSMHENDVTMADVEASGEKGRVLQADIDQVLINRQGQRNDQSMSQNMDQNMDQNNETAKPDANKDSEVSERFKDRPERRVTMSRLRQRVAERLVDAQRTAAILTTFNEVDLSDLARLRKTYQERFVHAHGIKLGFMSFFVKAATEALKRFPEVNARIDNNDIIYNGYYDIGVAVSTERGLVVPIIRDTDQLGHAEIEKRINDYATRARTGKLEMEELTGGTFSISNGGVFGSMLSTPILNPPQSGILGMHKIEERAVVRDGDIVIRPMMYLALSYDHRIIDGKTAVGFLMKIKDLLEDPASLLLEL